MSSHETKTSTRLDMTATAHLIAELRAIVWETRALHGDETPLPDGQGEVSRLDLTHAAVQAGVDFPTWLVTTPAFRVRRGWYRIPSLAECVSWQVGCAQ